MRHSSRFCLLFVAAVVAVFSPMASHAQDPVATMPKNYQVAFENSEVRVVRVTYGAHEKLPIHDHSKFPVIYVYLSDSPTIKFNHQESNGKTYIAIRPALKAGSYRVTAGGPERHSAENLGDIDSHYLRVELKRQPLKSGIEPMRSSPPDLTKTGLLNEFNSFYVRMDRVIADRKPVPVNGDEPSLLIAYAPALIQQSGAATAEPLNAGELRWMDAGHRFDVRSPGTVNAHVLRIVFTRR